MDISSVPPVSSNSALAMTPPRTAAQPPTSATGDDRELRQAFHRFVGETFYGQLMQSLRKTVDKPAYFHGGRGEEIFQAQLDQVLAERMTESTADTFTEPMYRLFQLGRAN